MGSRAWALLAALLSIPAVPSAAAPRVVAIGDVHGALEELDAILREASLTGADGSWTGGNAVLVQTGDFTDRGRRVRDVMDRLRELEAQAAAAGGAVHVLLGNHETMNLLGVLRDVNPDCFADFADADSETRRAEAWRRHRSHAAERASTLGQPAPELDEQSWLEAHPPGYLEYLEAFGPEGSYGRWLRGLKASLRIGDSVFVHGGFSPELSFESPEALNRALAKQIEAFDDARNHMIREGVILPWFDLSEIEAAVAGEIPVFVASMRGGRSGRTPLAEKRHRDALVALGDAGRGWGLRPDGPLWFRGFATWSDDEGAPLVRELLSRFGARRFVAGHSVLAPAGKIRARFGGGVFLIDTGMLREVYAGRPSALEIRGEAISALYPGEREVLWPPETSGAGCDGSC